MESYDADSHAMTLEPISNSFKEHGDAGELDEAEKVTDVVLPSNQEPAFPLKPCEVAFYEPASLVTA